MDQDSAKVKAFLRDRVQVDVKANAPRRARDRADLKHLRMYRGGSDNLWSVWDPNSQNYVARPTGTDDDAALPPWFFKPATNLFAVKTDGICSILNQSAPAQEYAGARNTDADRATAEIAEEAVPVLLEECGYPSFRAQLHKLITLTHAAAVHLSYDDDARHGMDDLPLLQCQNPDCRQFHLPHEIPSEGEGADVCPACHQPTVQEARHPQTGLAIGMPAPRGKICARILSSFEFSTPRATRELHEDRIPWIAGHGRMDAHEVLRQWPEAAQSVAPNAPGAGATKGESAHYADAMRALSSPATVAEGPTRSGMPVSASGPVVWMVWADPVEDEDFYFPDGLYAVMLEDELVLESGPLPFKDDQGRPFKNVLLRTFQSTPGAGWGKPPSDDLAPLQEQLQLCQALAFLILMHDAAPTTFIPDTVTLLEELSGMPGSTVPFKSLRAGDKPIITNGSGFPESLKWFIEWLEKQFDTVSKLNAVLMGQRPEGGKTTAFEIEVLQDRGMAAFREPLDHLIDFEKRLTRQLLSIARQCMWSPRFYQVAGENGDWDVKQFLGADLEGAVSIHVEPASAWPVSPMLKNLRLDKAFERQVLNPQDPEIQEAYLSLNDLTDFRTSIKEDQQQVARQLDAWTKATDPLQIAPPDPLWNLPYHFFKKVTWLKTETAERLAAETPAVYQAIRAHVQQIQVLMQPAAPAAQPGQPGGGPPTGQAVDAAVSSGALKPAPAAGAVPDGQAVTAAVRSGALRPAPAAPGVH